MRSGWSPIRSRTLGVVGTLWAKEMRQPHVRRDSLQTPFTSLAGGSFSPACLSANLRGQGRRAGACVAITRGWRPRWQLSIGQRYDLLQCRGWCRYSRQMMGAEGETGPSARAVVLDSDGRAVGGLTYQVYTRRQRRDTAFTTHLSRYFNQDHPDPWIEAY